MEDAWHMDDYQRMFEAELAAALEAHDEAALDVQGVVQRVLKETLPKVTDTLYAELAKRSKAMLHDRRGMRRGFVKRNIGRWRAGFDLLERLIVISEETGGAVNCALRPKAVGENDAQFEALISNHARAVQVSREILTLMVAGFPDGALGRWRTLHEIAVVSVFISDAGKEIAERYVLHDQVTAFKRAKNYMEHYKRGNLQPIDRHELSALEAAHDQVLQRFGKSMKNPYGWAAPAFNKDSPTFADLEQSTGLDHWRPRYKWATQNTHGSYRALGSTLATCESDTPVLSVGESNSGMTDPAHMTAISLNLATIPVILLEPNIDRLAAAQIMDRLSGEIGDTFFRLDKDTYEKARGKPKPKR